MGNEHSKKEVTSLPPEQTRKLRKQIAKEYPWLQGIEESMLITDMMQREQPIIYANEDFYKMTQYSPQEVLGFNCRFLQGKHTNPRTVTKMREAIQNGKELEVEILNYRKDGTPFINNFLMVPLHTKKNNPTLVPFFIAIQKDVTYLVQESDPDAWRASQVALWLEKAGYDEFVQPFIEHDIDGKQFLAMNASKLQKIGIQDVLMQNNILHLISMLETEGPDFVNDQLRSPIHTQTSGDNTDSESSNTFNSNNSYEYNFEAPDGIHSVVDLHQPKISALWRRQSFPVLTVPLNRKNSKPSISFQCFLQQEKNSSTKKISVKESALLFHVKREIKREFSLFDPFGLSVECKGEWKRINSQQEYRMFINEVKKKGNKEDIAVRVEKLSQEEEAEIRESIILALAPENSRISQRKLSWSTSRNDSEISYSFMIKKGDTCGRAMLYDSVVKPCSCEIVLHSLNCIWEPVLSNINTNGTCFVIPATSYGQLISDKELSEFTHLAACERLLEAKAEENSGEIPLGTTILVQIDLRFIVLVVMARNNLLEDKSSVESFYIAFRNILTTVDAHNQKIRSNETSPAVSLTREHPNQVIEELQMPVFFTPIDASCELPQRVPEVLKFGHQVRVAFQSFFRWKSCIKRKKPKTSYVKHITQFEKQLKKGFYKNYLNEKENRFLEHLSSGDLSVRGLADQREVEWLIEASGFTGDSKSRFTRSRRLQRLANIVLAALINEKRFLTGTKFQSNLRGCLIRNENCLSWLLKMAAAESISLCEKTTLDSIDGLQRFASGGTSSVHRGTWKKNNEQVAVKQFFPGQDRESILHEITLSCLLDHPNVLPVYAWGESRSELDSLLFSVAPLITGGSLFDVLRKNNPEFDFKARFQVFAQITVGLQYIHSLGLIHRDIKSLNILLTQTNHVYIADVGAMRLFDDKMTANTGTVFWMSPEMFGSTGYTRSTDIYSLAMLLYELILNKIPFKELKNYEVPGAVIKGVRPRIPNEVAKPWNKLLTSMWHPKPNKRPDISQVISSLIVLREIPFFSS